MKTLAAVLAIAFIYSTALNYEQDQRIRKLQKFMDTCQGRVVAQ